VFIYLQYYNDLKKLGISWDEVEETNIGGQEELHIEKSVSPNAS